MNKGLKESHIHINNNVDIINYNINLTTTNNNFVINIPLLNTINNLINFLLNQDLHDISVQLWDEYSYDEYGRIIYENNPSKRSLFDMWLEW